MKTYFDISRLGIWGCAVLVLTSSYSSAGQMYVYKDQSGSTLLTNRKMNDSSLKKVKVTYYPESNIHSYSNWGKSEAAVLPSYSKIVMLLII